MLTDDVLVNLMKSSEDEVIDISQKLLAKSRTKLFKQGDAIEAVINIRKNPIFGKNGMTEDVLLKIKGATDLPYHQVVANLDNFATKVKSNNIQLDDFEKLLADLQLGENKTDGANWVVKYLGDYADDFSNKRLKFEYQFKNDLGKRYVDVSDITDESELGEIIFYEFKSVATVPPGHFPEQFMKDLTNANSLDQIRWIFNGNKNPANFEINMKKALETLPTSKSFTDDLAQRLLQTEEATADELLELLIEEFNTIFRLKK